MSNNINDGYRLAHTMIRVKDLENSFNFYCKTLGMKVLRKTDYPDGKFTNAFIGYGLENESPCLELTLNWDQKDLGKYADHVTTNKGLMGGPNKVLYNRFTGDVFVGYYEA